MPKFAVSLADTFYDLNYVEIIEASCKTEAIANHSRSELTIDDIAEKGIADYRQLVTYYKDNHFTLIGIIDITGESNGK